MAEGPDNRMEQDLTSHVDGFSDAALDSVFAERERARRQTAFATARRHSRVVRILKIALPLTALALVVGFVGTAIIAQSGYGALLAGSALKDGRIVMTNPRMTGFTGDNQPYALEAREAYQAIGEGGLIEMVGISGTFPVSAATMAEIDAGSGTYDNAGRVFTFGGGLTVTTDDGMVVTMKSAKLDMADRTLETADPVDINAKGTQIQAESLHVVDGGAKMVFERKVRMVLDPGRVAQMRGGASQTGVAEPNQPAAAGQETKP